MTPRQLIDFIERKLTEHGVGKIVPDEEAMAAHYRQAAFEARLDRALAPLRAEFEERFRQVAQDLRESPDLDIDVPALVKPVRARLTRAPGQTWRDAVSAVAREMEQ